MKQKDQRLSTIKVQRYEKNVNHIYCLEEDLDFIKQITKLTNLSIVSNVYEINDKANNLVVFKEDLEDDASLEKVLDHVKHLIVIKKDESGIWISSHSLGDLGCIKCLSFYKNTPSLSFKRDLKMNNLDEIISKFLSGKKDKTFQRVLHISNDWKVNILTVLPSFFCSNCKELYKRNFTVNEFPTLKQRHFRKLNNEMISQLTRDIPLGTFSLFDRPEVFKYKDVYISRVKMKSKKNLYGIGRGFTKDQAIILSLFESLERLSLNGSIGLTNHIKSSYKHLPSAIHPSKLVENDKFNETNSYSWVFGLEVSTGEKVMIPEQLVLIEDAEVLKNKGEEKFYSATSNGTAVGGSFEEAAFFALLEYFERENGVKAWNLKENLKRWPLSFFHTNKRIKKLITFFKENHCDITILNTSNIQTLTTVWVHLSWKNGQLNTLGSGVSPGDAVEGALLELFTGYLNFNTLNQRQEQRINHLNEKNQLETMEDHVLYYIQKEKSHEFTFMQNIPYDDISNFKKLNNYIDGMLSQGLNKCLRMVLDEMNLFGRNMYVVNLTPSILKEIDSKLSIAKVFMSNSYHFNFGQYDNKQNPHPFL